MVLFRLITIAASLTSVLAKSSPAPIPPKQDPWYTAPAGYESTSPGAVLRVRVAPGNLTTIYGNSSAAWNILYRTTDSNYQPSWAVTTLFAPKQNHSSSRSTSMVSYQIPYNSPDLNASPSFGLYDPTYYTSTFYPGSIIGDIQTLLSYGYYVNTPDYEGPLAAFACAVSEGHATLDSIRAVKSLTTSWAPKDARVTMWGYSGGSLASEFAAELQVQYAPELEIAGTAIGGLVTNGSTALHLASSGPFAVLVAAGLVGVSKQHADVNKTLFANLKKTGLFNASTFLSVNDFPLVQSAARFAFQDMWQYLTIGEAILETPAFVKALDSDAVMGYHGTPQMPMFVYKAVNDELIPSNQTDALVERYCADGANIVYQRNTIGGHLAEETNGDASALRWLQSVLGRSYNHTGCTVQTVAQNVTSSSI